MPKAKRKKLNERSEGIYAKALELINNGMSIRRCSGLLNIPRSTLSDKYHGHTSVNALKGPPSIISLSEESHLVEWLLQRNKSGFPITKDQLLDSVKLLMLQWERNNPFLDNRPGRKWYEAFLRRHPQLTQTGAQSLTTVKAEIPLGKVTQWLESVAEHLSKKSLINIDASRYYSIDETYFLLNPPQAGRKSKNSKDIVSGVFVTSANGVVAPPMLVYPYKRIPPIVAKSVPPTWHMGASESGRVTPELFLDYIKSKLHTWLLAEDRQFPIVLFFNGHSAHFTLPLAEFCKENNIELMPLYSNAKQIRLPVKSALIQPLQNVWPQAVGNWRRENSGVKLKRETFATVLKTALDSLDVEAAIKNAFKSCGLYPFVFEHIGFYIFSDEKKAEESSDATKERLQAGRRLKMVLSVVEENLPQELLRKFKKSKLKGVWRGELENRGLFEFWLNISRKTEEIDDANEYNNDEDKAATEDSELSNEKMDGSEDEEDESSDDEESEEIDLSMHGVEEPKTSRCTRKQVKQS